MTGPHQNRQPASLAAQRLPIALLSALMFILAAASLIVLGLGAQIAAGTGLAEAEAGLLVTAFALPYALLAPLFQLVAGGHVGPRAVIVAGALTMAAGLILTALAPNASVLLSARALTAAGAALIAPAALATATFLVAEEQRGRAIAAVYLGFTLASVIGVPLGTQLAQWFDWRTTFALFAASALLAALSARFALPQLSAANPLPTAAVRRLLANRRLQFIFAAAVLQLAAQFVLLAPMAPMLLSYFALPSELLAPVLLVFGLAGVAGNWVGGVVADRLELTVSLRLSLVGLALALLAFTWPLNGYGAAAAFAALAFFGTLFRPAQLVLLTGAVSADERGLAIGLNTSASYIGLTLGSAASAAAITGAGYGALGWLALAFTALAAIVVERTRPDTSESPHEP